MHDPFAVHMLQGGSYLDEIFPDGLFSNEPPLTPEVVEHPGHIASVCQLQNYV